MFNALRGTLGVTETPPTIPNQLENATPSAPSPEVSTLPNSEDTHDISNSGFITQKIARSFAEGFLSPHFVTNVARKEAELEDSFILLTDQKISDLKEILPLLEKVLQTGKPLVIIAEDVVGETLVTLEVNKVRGVLELAAVKAPSSDDHREEMLQDMATFTGGTVISEKVGLKLENADLSLLGKARKVLITENTTTILRYAD